MPLSEGTILENRYRIRGVLGEGGMSRVYLADDLRLKIQVALKENLQTSAESHRQFTQEAEMLARLSHPNLPRVIDFFTSHETGKQYFVMDYIAGEDLDKLVKRVGPLNEATALNWIRQILGALEYLHSQTPPIIHRDVKPSNIKITPDGKAVLVDFGIAKIYDARGGTMTGARAVTPGYAAPEQYGLRTDARSDIYSLGATLYTMLTGRIPPEAPLRMSDAEKLIAPRELNRTLSPNLENVLLRAMALSTTKRLQSVSQLRTALEGRAVASTTESEGKTVFVPRRSATIERKQTLPLWLIPAIAAALLLIVGGILVMPLLFGNAPTQVAEVSATPTRISIPPTSTRASNPTTTIVVVAQNTVPPTATETKVPIEEIATAIPEQHWQTLSGMNEVHDLFLDGTTLWIATSGGLVQLNTRDESYQVFTVDNGLFANDLYAVFVDSFGTLWIGSRSAGLAKRVSNQWVDVGGKDILGSDTVQDIVQDKDGNLWVATLGGGVSRFDGSSWTRFTPDNSTVALNVYVIYVDEDGSLWFGSGDRTCFPCGADLAHFTGGKWESFGREDGIPGWEEREQADVWHIVRVPDGDLWIATPNSGSAVYRNGKWEKVVDSEVLVWDGDSVLDTNFNRYDGNTAKLTGSETIDSPFGWTATMLLGADGSQWAGGSSGLIGKFDGSTWRRYALPGILYRNPTSSQAIAQSSDGNLWVADARTVTNFDGKSMQLISSQTPDISFPWNVFVASDGTVWVGGQSGIASYSNGKWTTQQSDYQIDKIIESLSGTIWFNTSYDGAVIRYSKGQWTTYSNKQGDLPGDYINDISSSPSGDTWISSSRGAIRVPAHAEKSSWQIFSPNEGLPFDSVERVLEDGAGRYWFAGYNSIAMRDRNGAWKQWTEDELGVQAMRDLEVDRQGVIWVAARGLAKYQAGKWTQVLSGEVTGYIQELLESSDGALWARTYGAGVFRIKDQVTTQYTAQPYGLASNFADCLFEAADQTIWICTEGGLSHIILTDR